MKVPTLACSLLRSKGAQAGARRREHLNPGHGVRYTTLNGIRNLFVANFRNTFESPNMDMTDGCLWSSHAAAERTFFLFLLAVASSSSAKVL